MLKLDNIRVRDVMRASVLPLPSAASYAFKMAAASAEGAVGKKAFYYSTKHCLLPYLI
jgi:hypothetical protein